MDTATTPIVIFVYGTLKRGGRYHNRFCKYGKDIVPASVWGRLYDGDLGYPLLSIPQEAVLAEATNDPAADAELQRTFESKNRSEPRCPVGDRDTVYGELITFPDPLRSLPPIDQLEDFQADRDTNLYFRRLVMTQTDHGPRPAWLYTSHPKLIEGARIVHGGDWPVG